MSLTLGSARPMPLLLGRLFFLGGGVAVVLLWQTPPFPGEALQPLGTVRCSAGHGEVHRSKRNFLQDYT